MRYVTRLTVPVESAPEVCRLSEGLIIGDPKVFLPHGTTGGEKCECFAVKMTEDVNEAVDHPRHYGGEDNPYEAIKVIEAWGLGFATGNAVKYVSRAGKKDPSRLVEDLEKARWYLDREIKRLKGTR